MYLPIKDPVEHFLTCLQSAFSEKCIGCRGEEDNLVFFVINLDKNQ